MDPLTISVTVQKITTSVAGWITRLVLDHNATVSIGPVGGDSQLIRVVVKAQRDDHIFALAGIVEGVFDVSIEGVGSAPPSSS